MTRALVEATRRDGRGRRGMRGGANGSEWARRELVLPSAQFVEGDLMAKGVALTIGLNAVDPGHYQLEW